jgi:hypothetical protein
VVENAPHVDLAGEPLCIVSPSASPESRGAVAAWLRQVDCSAAQTEVLGNAARFFFLHNPTVCEALLIRARDLEPQVPEWYRRLAELYMLRASSRSCSTGDGRHWAAKALGEWEQASRMVFDEATRLFIQMSAATAAFMSGDETKARQYAEILTRSEGRGEWRFTAAQAYHHGHQILGHLSLVSGDKVGANRHLLASATASHSVDLTMIVPRMALAKELLVQGERTTVLLYLRLCSLFWHTPDQRIDQWIYTLVHGGTPNFGPAAFP